MSGRFISHILVRCVSMAECVVYNFTVAVNVSCDKVKNDDNNCIIKSERG
jgi:hypothetical protein